MNISVEISRVCDFAELGSRWCALEQRSQCSFFTSWGWLETWLSQLPEQYEPYIICARHAERDVGLGVLVFGNGRRHGVLPSRQCHLHESGNARIDDIVIEHNGFLLESGVEQATTDALLTHLLEDERWDELCVSGVLDNNPLMQSVVVADGGRLSKRFEKQYPNYYVDLRALRALRTDYLDTRSSGTRYNIRRSLRGWKKHGEVKTRAAATLEEAYDFLDRLKKFHQDAWQKRGESGAFADPFFETFHRALIAARFEYGEIQLLQIKAGDIEIGYLYNFSFSGTTYYYQSGFNYEHAKLRPGLVSYYSAIEFNAQNGCERFDLLAGDSDFKRALGTNSQDIYWLMLQRDLAKYRIENRLRSVKRALAA